MHRVKPYDCAFRLFADTGHWKGWLMGLVKSSSSSWLLRSVEVRLWEKQLSKDGSFSSLQKMPPSFSLHMLCLEQTLIVLFHFESGVLVTFLAECTQILSGCSLFGFPNSVLGPFWILTWVEMRSYCFQLDGFRLNILDVSTNDEESWENESNISNLLSLICKMAITYFTPLKG